MLPLIELLKYSLDMRSFNKVLQMLAVRNFA